MKNYFLLSLVLLTFVFLNSQFSTFNSFAQTAPPVQRNISVSAFVPPKASDFQFSFATDGKGTVPQDEKLLYEITYGASSSAEVNTRTTILVNYSPDKAPDNSYAIDYVLGSASNAYGGVQPVIDAKNRTITWTIPSLPAGTVDQKVTFRLQTTSNYAGLQTVSFTNRASFSNEYVTLPEQRLTQYYQYDKTRVVPGPTATPAPPAPTAVPSPTITPPPLQIVDIPVTSISDSSVTINITSNRSSNVSVRYGTDPNNMSQTRSTDGYALTHSITLDSLTPRTQYYYQISVLDRSGQRIESEIFTFTTAQVSTPVQLSLATVVITSGGKVILSDTLSRETPFGILLTDTDYQLTYTLSHDADLDMEAIVRSRTGTDRTVGMTALNQRSYNAQLRAGIPGNYDVYVRATDTYGNVIEQIVARIKIVSPLSVRDSRNDQPIADARILFSKFDKNTNGFTRILVDNNPGFTDASGQFAMLLPAGRYRAEVSALGYSPQTVEFTLGEQPGQEFPTIRLVFDPFNLFALLRYVIDQMIDSVYILLNAAYALVTSPRFFAIMASTALSSFVSVSFLFFTFRTNIRWRDLFPFLVFNILAIAGRHHRVFLHGWIIDVNHKPVSDARIDVIDNKTGTVLTHTFSNKSGKFIVNKTFNQQYVKLQVTKDGFTQAEHIVSTDTDKDITIRIAQHSESEMAVIGGFRHLSSELFEFTLLICFIAELVFLLTFGIAKTLPFFLLSVANLLLWIAFQRQKQG